MEKILTIFDRDWQGQKGVINEYIVEPGVLAATLATEKVDGTNVRLTVRNHTLVRLEKRRNPDKVQKAKGITEPWYVDADEFSTGDKWIFDAARNLDLTDIEDGEWSGEAFGKNIQGNPLQWEQNHIFLFSHMPTLLKHTLPDAPIAFEELKAWLPRQKSTFNAERGIEGLVWWQDGQPIGKIKLKDFSTR